MKKSKIVIAGDIGPRPSNQIYFENADLKALLGEELLDIWMDADIRVCNLECPLIEVNAIPSLKNGPNLRASVESINGIKKLKPTAISLANNHILDYGEEGIFSTTKLLEKNDINFFGVGNSKNNLKNFNIFNLSGKKFGFYSIAENEECVATDERAGANPFEELRCNLEISNLKEKVDYLIVLYHGGKEYYRFPSPNLQSRCRQFVKSGADLVLCQHTHCIGCSENFLNSKIYYGQGNFLWNNSNDINDFVESGILIELVIEESRIDVKNYFVKRTSTGTSLADVDYRNKVESEFLERSRKIKDPIFVKNEFVKFSKSILPMYLRTMLAITLNSYKLSFVVQKIFGRKRNKKQIVNLLNFLKCESHNEVLITALENLINED